MAVTAKFSADFSSFLTAIDKAEVKLTDFGAGAESVEKKLNRMVDQFSGRKVVQEATLMATALEAAGGTAILSGRELEAMGAKASEAIEKAKRLGMDVPPGLQRIADAAKAASDETRSLGHAGETASTSWSQFVQGFDVQGAITNPLATAKSGALALAESIGGTALAATAAIGAVAALGAELFKVTKDAADIGAALDDMADKTGLSVPALSRLQNAAQVIGADMTTLTDVIFKLEQRIGENSDEFQAGLAKMGLSTEALKAAGPDRYLELITKGLNDLGDISERNSAGVAVMGRGFKDVAASLVDLEEGLRLTADITPWTRQQAADAEKFDNQLQSLIVHAKALGVAFGRDLIEPLSTLVGWFEKGGAAGAKFLAIVSGIPAWGSLVKDAWQYAGEGISYFRGQAVSVPPDMLKATTATTKAAKDIQGFGGVALGAGLDAGHLAQATTILTASAEKSIDAHKKAQKALEDEDKALLKVTTTVGLLDGEWQKARGLTVAGDRINTVIPMFTKLEAGLQGMDAVLVPLDATMLQFANVTIPNLTGSLHTNQTTLTKWLDVLDDGLASLPRLVQQGLTGGGGLSGALKAVTSQMGSGLFTAGGPLNALGNTLTKGAFKLSETLGNVVGAAIPGLGSLLGPAISGIGALFGKLFDNPEKKINPIREAFVQAAGGLAELNARAHDAGITLNELLNAKNPEMYQKAIENLSAAFKFQDDAMATLQATAAKYGFTLAELGPVLQRQELGRQAEDIYRDFQILTAGGLDHVAVLEKMSESVNTYVQNAAAMGIEVPASMEPLLQQMIDAGLLTDKAGDKVEDLTDTGIVFSKTMSQAFADMIASVDKLTAAITRGLNPALANIKAPDVTVGVHYRYDDFDPPVRAMATGGSGRVTAPTLFLAGEAGPEDYSFKRAGSGGAVAGADGITDRLDALIAEQRATRTDLPRMIRDAMLLAS